MELRSKKRVPYRSTKIPANSSAFRNTNAVQSFEREQGKALKTRKRTRHNEIEPGDGRPAKRSHLHPHEGLLMNLVEAPVDVLFEIFGLLEPRDLLHIARTTKSLRSLLMSRSSVTVWKSARSNIFGLPDCPDDLSEPQYAALMFVKRCTLCPKATSNVYVNWYSRIRCCRRCLQSRSKFGLLTEDDRNFFEYKGFAPRLTRGYPTLLANWLPFIRIKDRKTNYGHDIYYLKSVDNQWKDEFGALEDEESQSKWLFRTLESRDAIQKHAHACAFWEKVYSRRQNVTQDWMQRVFERFKMAEDHVKKIGIEEDLLKLPPAESDIPDQTCDRILESCDLPWTVSEGYLSSLKHDLGSRTCVQYLNKLRKYLEYEELHRSRMRILSGIYNSALHRVSLDVPFPSLGQAFRIIEDHDLLDYSEEILRVSFEEVISLWRKHVERELVELVAAVVEHPVTKAVDLNLATTMFICPNESSCPTNTMLRPNQAMVHPCVQAVEPYLIPALSGWTPADTFRSQFGAVAWCDGSGGVRFSKADFLVLEGVVKMLGLDPQVTTSRQMDELDSILECRACNSFEEGRAALSWAAVPGHQRKAHNGSSDIHALTVLEEPEATYVRKRIKEEQATSYQLKTDCEVICMHCNSLILGLGVYREHLKEAHHIFDYNGEEVVYSVHENQIPPLYRL